MIIYAHSLTHLKPTRAQDKKQIRMVWWYVEKFCLLFFTLCCFQHLFGRPRFRVNDHVAQRLSLHFDGDAYIHRAENIWDRSLCSRASRKILRATSLHQSQSAGASRCFDHALIELSGLAPAAASTRCATMDAVGSLMRASSLSRPAFLLVPRREKQKPPPPARAGKCK